MIANIEIWLIKWVAGILIGRLEKRAANSPIAAKILEGIRNPIPLTPDPNPSPASLRNPPRYGG